MLNNQKKFGIGLVLTASVLLIAAFLAVPFGAAVTVRNTLAIIGVLMFIVAAPVMWQDGIRSIKSGKKPHGSWLSMRQSGFYDIVMLMLIAAVVMAALGCFGLVTYNATLKHHVGLAGGTASTIEEARLLPEFVEYNFKQDLNLLAENYHAFFAITLILVVASVVCLVYMRFVSPIVRADESLQKAHRIYRLVAQYAGAIFVVLIMLFPIYWMIISSFKTSTELLAPVPTLWPKEFMWENYPNVLNRAPFVKYLVNTLATTVVMMLGELTIGVMAAYGFAKGEFKGREFMFMLVLGALMVPIQVTFVPIYVFIARLNTIDTYMGVILPNLVSAYFIFMLRQNFMAVDNSYIEAGKVDGMGRFGTIFHVLCPMCKPTLITVSIISFINGWNSYFWPKMVTKTEASRTIAVGVQQLKNTFAGMEVSNYNEIMAGAVMAIVPIIALFLILQKYIMTGMSKAAMK